MTASALKKLELKDAGLLIVATPGPDEWTKGPARLLGVSVVDGSDAVDAAAAVRDSAAGDAQPPLPPPSTLPLSRSP